MIYGALIQSSMINYSFIIPHHNTPDLLLRLIDSIPQREDIEIIVVDDNSDADKKPSIVRDDVKFFYIDKEHTKGAGRARNVGLEHANGKWLIFADSDDFFSVAISDLLDKYKDSDSDLVYFKVEGRDSETLNLVSRGMIYNQYLDKYERLHNDYAADILKYSHVVPWCKIIRRSLVEINNIRFEEVRYSNDVMFITKVANSARKIEVSDIVAYYVTVRLGSLISQKSVESRRCRSAVAIRQKKFLWDNHRWRMMTSCIFGLMYILKKYGLSECIVYIKMYRANNIGLMQILVSEFLNLFNLMAKYYTYDRF